MATLAATVALVLAVLYLSVTFLWRTVAHRRATGSTGIRGVSGGPASPAWWGGMLFALGGALMAAAPALALSGLLAPPAGWPHPLVAAVGLVTTLTGIGLAVAAQRELGTAWRIGVDVDERTTLVTTGVFAHVRNPFFTAMATVAVGLAAMVPTPVGACAALLLGVAMEIQVRSAEEPYLRRVHGLAYEAYAVRTGRFLPRVGRKPARR